MCIKDKEGTSRYVNLLGGVRIRIMVFNATFNNISVISWRYTQRKPQTLSQVTEIGKREPCYKNCQDFIGLFFYTNLQN
jgi:hypothetical protein